MNLRDLYAAVVARAQLSLLRRQPHPETWDRHAFWVAEAQRLSARPSGADGESDEVHRLSETLRADVFAAFRDRYRSHCGLRVMVHVPDPRIGIGGTSLYRS